MEDVIFACQMFKGLITLGVGENVRASVTSLGGSSGLLQVTEEGVQLSALYPWSSPETYLPEGLRCPLTSPGSLWPPDLSSTFPLVKKWGLKT